MHINTIEEILRKLSEKVDMSKYKNDIEGFKKYLEEQFPEDLNVSVESFNKYVNSINQDPVQLMNKLKKDIKEDFQANKIKISLDSSFGKFNIKKEKIRQHVIENLNKYCEFRAWQFRAGKFLTPSVNKRIPETIMHTLCPNDKEQATEYYQIMEHKNEEIDPISGKSYGQLKLAYITKGLNRFKQATNQVLRCKDRKDLGKKFATDINLFMGVFELDGNKFDQFLDALNIDKAYIDKECPEFNDTLKYLNENKADLNSLGQITQDVAYLTNPLYPYASDEDLTLVGKFANNGIYDTIIFECEQIEGQKVNPVDALSGTSTIYEFEKVLKYDNAETEIEQFYNNLKLFVEPNTNTKRENMRFYHGNKEIEIDKKDLFESMKKVGRLVRDGETVTIRDNNGKFLLNYQSNIEHFLIPDIGNLSIDTHTIFEKELKKELRANTIKIGDYEKDFTEELDSHEKAIAKALGNLKQDIKKEGARINEVISGKIERHIEDRVSMMKKLLDSVGPDKNRKVDDSYFYDIKDMLKDVISKQDKNGKDISFYKDKDAYIHGLKSIRTFCQAYLDEKTGTKMNRTEKAKYEAITNVYTSLYGIEQQLSEAKDFENNIEVELNLKVRKDNPEFIKAVESKEIKRPKLFDEMNKEEKKEYLTKYIKEKEEQNKEIKEVSKVKTLEVSKGKEIGK